MKNNSLWIILHKMRIPFIVIICTYTISISGLLLIDGVTKNGHVYHMTIFDAFYFISYTSTTIGFGESPFDFTYAQKIWVVFCIYLTVIGWFYAIGSLLSLLQNKLFLNEVAKLRFKHSLDRIRGNFIIILGYNAITLEIIKKSIERDTRVVVIEHNQDRANELIAESFTPTIPVLVSNASAIKSLDYAGIKYKNCKGVVSLFEEDKLNLRIAIVSKILNKNIKLAIKSTSPNKVENLLDANVEIIENPFEVITNQVKMAISYPHSLKLEKWLYSLDILSSHMPSLPSKGIYIVCGYGRLGKYIYDMSKKLSDIKMYFIEIDKNKFQDLSEHEKEIFILADADTKEALCKAEIHEAKAILAFTNDDTTNLSILTTAKKLNPKITTLVREVEIDDLSVFLHAKIDFIFIPAKILIHKTINALFNPLCDRFLNLLYTQEDYWAQVLIKKLLETINNNPLTYELKITNKTAFELYRNLEQGLEVNLELLHKSLYNKFEKNNLVALLIYRDKKSWLLPSLDEKLKIGDEILFAGDENAILDLEYIINNKDEFAYVYNNEKGVKK